MKIFIKDIGIKRHYKNSSIIFGVAYTDFYLPYLKRPQLYLIRATVQTEEIN